ncbi:Beta-glucan synthesis-associated protein KRE6 [Hypsizygus marmoreus]|uniref:Beta-glucan synthesis-associated protein KRE6 n=1 Tax=Hypsizygus marmoreus TaxID=39966 RepID=A0A369JAY6_HYPMA|nr:Beta-glucan synthesis-associated protein KRE6 [Hypsizygus marmoreus]
MASQFTLHTSASATSLLPSSAPRSESGGRHSSGYPASLSEKYSLAPSPAQWGMPNLNQPEPDDDLHNPDPKRDRMNDKGGTIITARGLANLGCLFILGAGIIMLFGGKRSPRKGRFPILTHFLTKPQTTQGGFNLGGINATGQIADMPGNWALIDRDTPKEAYTKKSYINKNDDWVLVFSDEFNLEGRSFYPGDDPYWEAVDLHYWGTNDLEWYDPSGATTKDGYLHLKLEKVDDPATNHNLSYKSGMLQTWNKFCFTGGIIETSVSLPGDNNVHGLWPAVWTMGNLGRAGFGASLEGLWPYSYDACDVGTLPNQTYPGTQTPLLAVSQGDPANNDELSFLPGQRLSACTCPGESHPGPVRSDGSYVGRAAPEIDVFEAIVDHGVGKVSLSAQFAPFNAEYAWFNTTDNYDIVDPETTELNEYRGGAFQQTTSGLALTNQDCYERNTGCFSVYGYQYKPGFDNAYISWINDGKLAWTVKQGGLKKDPRVEISERPIPQEPMYIIANLGFSLNFGGIDFENIILPATMRVDWIRVYQSPDARNIGCDPPEFPTATYIETYKEAYTNPNLTLWTDDYKQPWPKNRIDGVGC